MAQIVGMMSPLASRGRRPMRMLGAVETLRDVVVFFWGLAALLVIALGALIVLGLGVHGLSKLLGTPLPMVHDDPTRVEWDGLAVDLLYGCIGAAALFACYARGRRLLGATAREHVGRGLGTLALLGLAVAGAVVAVGQHDVKAGVFALLMGVWATRVARGLSIDDEEDGDDRASALPASFDTSVAIVNEEPRARVDTWTQPPQRPFVAPTGRESAPGLPSHVEPIDGDDDPPRKEDAAGA